VANAIGFDERNRLYGLFDHLATVRLVPPEATSFEGADCLSFSDISTKFSGLGSFYALTSKNGQIVAGGRDGVVRAWKTSPPPTAGIVHRIWRNGYSPVFSLALTDDARWIISGDQAGRLHLIDSESTKITPKMTFPSAHQDLVSAIAIIRRASSTNQGSIIASGSQNGALRLWSLDVTSGREQIIPLVELPPMPSPIRKLEFLSKPKLSLAVHTEGLSGLRLWSIERILELCESH
jgi:WD40 repeat protein